MALPSFELNGEIYMVDEDGYLADFQQWNQEIAIHLATHNHITMTDAHWEIVHFLRKYYQEYRIAPMIRILTRVIGKTFGKEKGTTRYLYELFPDGPAKQACKIAGLPKPTGCV
ncbi:MAG: TusE/DsrC/DsvC family sulfur relay protein [Magnetococcales bacterium]|nr:TusE/DsrC/DsvC family sulfur relay protein [Magnetococcales bacterium]